MIGAISSLIPNPVNLGLAAAPYVALVGVSLFAWHCDNRAVANAELVRSQAASFKMAQAQATVIAQQALAHEQSVYQQKAMEADDAYKTSLADAGASAARYIAAHSVSRMQSAAVAGGSGTTVASAQSGNPAVPASVPTDSVMVSASDVQACTNGITYALKAHEWVNNVNR